jgi:hypothetical protein
MLKIFLGLLLAASPAFAADTWPMGRYGGTPTISACGTGATLAANSFDSGGTINIGTGVVSVCKLSFSTTYNPRLRCVVSASGLAVSIPMTITTTDVTFVAVLTGATSIDYFCWTP